MIDHQTFNIIVWIWIAIALLILPVLFKFKAPYGRHTSKKWGPLIDNRLGWVIMEAPSLIIFSLLFIMGTQTKTPVTWIFFGLWFFHYFNRTIIFPLRTKTKGKKMPLMIAGNAIFFNAVNGSLNGYYLGTLGPVYELSWMLDPRFIIGIVLFVGGVIINWHSDHILLNLRKPGESGYKIPKGGLFKYISCPNYFGEIIEWTGFALMTWSLPALSFAIWTMANLIPRAIDHHKWYEAQFENYPKERKIVLPFIL